MIFSHLLQVKQFQRGQCLNEIHQREIEQKSVLVEITLNKLQYGNEVHCATHKHVKRLMLPNRNYLWPLINPKVLGLWLVGVFFFKRVESQWLNFGLGS